MKYTQVLPIMIIGSNFDAQKVLIFFMIKNILRKTEPFYTNVRKLYFWQVWEYIYSLFHDYILLEECYIWYLYMYKYISMRHERSVRLGRMHYKNHYHVFYSLSVIFCSVNNIYYNLLFVKIYSSCKKFHWCV